MSKILKKLNNIITDKIFIITCLPCIILSIIQAIYKIYYYSQYYKIINDNNNITYNPHWAIYSIYQLWIGCDVSYFSTIIPYLFSIQISIFCVMLCKPIIKTKYNLKNKYIFFSDYIALFISFGMFELIPLLLNFLLLSLFIPIISPDSIYDIYYNFFAKDFMAKTFYSAPIIYISFFITLNFIMFGLIGCISISIFEKHNKFTMLVVLPELIIIIFDLTKSIWNDFIFKKEISPLSFLIPAKSHETNFIIIISELTICLLTILIIRKKKK